MAIAKRLPPELWAGALALVVLLAAVACSPADSPLSAHDLAGDYIRTHRVWVFHGNEPVEVEVADRLLVTAEDSGSFSFQLELLAVNGRQCRLEGLAERDRDLFASVESGNEPRTHCELRFRPEEGFIIVIDPESRCSTAHCGVPGVLDRLSFSRSEREELLD